MRKLILFIGVIAMLSACGGQSALNKQYDESTKGDDLKAAAKEKQLDEASTAQVETYINTQIEEGQAESTLTGKTYAEIIEAATTEAPAEDTSTEDATAADTTNAEGDESASEADESTSQEGDEQSNSSN